MMKREIPERPWQIIACDLFNHAEKEYLIPVDYYSDFFEVDLLSTTTSGAVVNKLRGHISRHGIPDIVISDNETQFSNQEFLNFSKKWDFTHESSS
ncbi:hypothetical protein, partial [Streptococcus dysgalactiae]|uniref:hypothetical protein n=1 Tax=Streptococcus dysgalactiae TaxID=1334 RepID=UPI00194FFA74